VTGGDGFDVRTLSATFRTGAALASHRHRWGQLVFAASGVMRVATERAAWLVPPTRAIWLPAGLAHSLAMQGEVALRTLYIDAERAAPLPATPSVLEVAPLLRELILHILAIGMLDPGDPRHDRAAGLLIDLMLAARPVDLSLPMPRDPRALRLARLWQDDPGDGRGLAELAAESGASLRTLQRLFPVETGLTIEAWRQKARLIHAVGRLASGASVTEAALDCGYQSLSAFASAFARQFGHTPGSARR
jgi:AraC-like DNA-binding protein